LLPVSSTQDPPRQEGSADIDRITAELGEIGSALAALTEAVDRETERAAHREAIIDRLHEDNQLLRRGELEAMYEPVRSTLYRLHDMVKRESEHWAAPQPPDPAHIAPLLSAVADEIAEALARSGVERFTVRPGDLYDASRHRPVAAEPVDTPKLDGTVVRARTDGFSRCDRVVRRADVVVARFTADDMDISPHPDPE
jgi:molecular chaperone GrpE (heat shock protein)